MASSSAPGSGAAARAVQQSAGARIAAALGPYSAGNPNGPLPGQVAMGLNGGLPTYADSAAPAGSAPTPGPTDNPAVDNYLHALANSSTYLHALAGAKDAAAQPTMNDYITAILGESAPTAPSASDFGPAPTLSDFYSAAPYQQAMQAVAAGGKTAQGSINNAFTQGGQNLAAIQSAGNGQQQAFNTQQSADTANTNSQIASILANAAKIGGGDSVVAGLSPLKADVAASQGAQNSLMNTLGSLQQTANSGFTQGMALNHQGSLDALAAALSGENNRIGLAQANDQARAQQMLASANSARGVGEAKANAEYQSALKAYEAQRTSVLRGAEGQASQNAPSNHAAALQQLAGFQSAGNANGDALFNAGYQLLNGVQPNGQPVSGWKGTAGSEAEAMNRLDNSPAIPKGSPMYQILAGWLNQYYMGGKTNPDVTGTLRQMAGY